MTATALEPTPDVRARPHRFLTLAVALLPLSYVPHEIVRTDFRFAYLEIAVVLALGVAYRVHRRPVRAPEIVLLAFGLWAVARYVVIAWTDTGVPAVEIAARETVTLIAAAALFRLAGTPELRPAIMRGLVAALALMLVVEMYQVVVGLPTLLALGYEAPEFHYNTADGGYRPFGTLQSPVVFGTYLAMVGIAVTLGTRRWTAVSAGVATAVGLALTQTRSAWIAFAIGLGVALLLQPRSTRAAKLLVLVPVAWAAALAAVLRPEVVASLTARLGSVTDTSDTSRSIRLELWSGLLTAAADRPLDGFGPASFEVVMRPVVGTLATFGHPHNTYLQILYLYGGVGLVLFVALFGALLLRGGAADGEGARLRVAAVAAVVTYLVGSFFESTWTSVNVVATLFLLAGLATTPPTHPATRSGLP